MDDSDQKPVRLDWSGMGWRPPTLEEVIANPLWLKIAPPVPFDTKVDTSGKINWD